jgi:Domain of unknown function (DUF4124)
MIAKVWAARRTAAHSAMLAVLGLAGLLIATIGHADGTVYKWVDEQGRVHYSDRPPPGQESKAETVANPYAKATVKAAAPATAGAAAPGAAANGKPGQPGVAADDPKKKVAADVAAAHAEDCGKARDAYETAIRSRRLYRTGENNERVYLTDAELDQTRVESRRLMDEACGSSGGNP